MQVDTRPISALAPYARNARTHSPAQIDKLCKSIKEFGWTVPLYCDVSVRRWQEFTKRHAVRERDGRAFDEIAAQRTDAQ